MAWTRRAGAVLLVLCLSTTGLEAATITTATASATATATASSSSTSNGQPTMAFADAAASSTNGGNANVESRASATDGGTAISKVKGVAKDGATVNVQGTAVARDQEALAIVDSVVAATGNAVATGNAFATAIQKGNGPVVAHAFLHAVSRGGTVRDQVTTAFVNAVATAIGQGRQNTDTVATTIATAVAEKGESRKVLGSALSILLVQKQCGPIQETLQLAEAKASSSGLQSAFLHVINVDAKLIICAFPKCHLDGNDKRAVCCSNSEAKRTGQCGHCDSNGCDFRLIWGNPTPLWNCEKVVCNQKKPCLC